MAQIILCTVAVTLFFVSMIFNVIEMRDMYEMKKKVLEMKDEVDKIIKKYNGKT